MVGGKNRKGFCSQCECFGHKCCILSIVCGIFNANLARCEGRGLLYYRNVVNMKYTQHKEVPICINNCAAFPPRQSFTFFANTLQVNRFGGSLLRMGGNMNDCMSRVFLEKLMGTQPIKKFPAFHGTLRFITAITKARYLSIS